MDHIQDEAEVQTREICGGQSAQVIPEPLPANLDENHQQQGKETGIFKKSLVRGKAFLPLSN